jgi:hypothetical protein
MTAKEQAQKMFNENYVIIFENGGELAEEITIGILSKLMALKQVSEILKASPSRYHPTTGTKIDNTMYWLAVHEALKKL